MTTLFDEFTASSPETWKERLEKDLKGITFTDLSVQDRNGLTIHPFYTAEDLPEQATPAFTHQDWAICAAVNASDAQTANQQALHELNSGASALCFTLDGNTSLHTLLQGIELPYIHTRFCISDNLPAFLAQWRSLQGNDTAVCYDPIARYLGGENWDNGIAREDFNALFDATKQVCVEARLYQDAGANSVWQLACCIAQLNEYLHWLQAGDKLNELEKVNLSVSTGTDFFEEISKLRALHRLAENLLRAYGVQASVQIHTETSDTYRSAFDSYSNLLRDTIAGMAAVLGGCHSLLIHPFDQGKNAPNEFSSRMSRNQQLIFKEECYLHQVADAAAGSFYLEQLAEQLAQGAWQVFKEIETDGGLVAAFEQGKIVAAIEAQAAAWIAEYRSGKRVLIGVNKYINAQDEPKPVAPQKAKAGLQPVPLTELLTIH